MAFLRALYPVLSHPTTIILGVVPGFGVGFRIPEFLARLKPAANIYIALISVTLRR